MTVGLYRPCRCPKCGEIILDTSLEMWDLRYAMWLKHKRVCPVLNAEQEVETTTDFETAGIIGQIHAVASS